MSMLQFVMVPLYLVLLFFDPIQSIRTQSYECPKSCDCLKTLVDCAKIKGLPESLPPWTESLELHSNNLQELPEDFFHELHNLTHIDLSNNRLLTNESETALRSVSRLIDLKLSKNQLDRVPQLQGLQELHTLNLANNQIQTLDKGVFEDLPSLRVLDLGFNRLTSLPLGVFTNGSAPLHVLLLHGNRLTYLEQTSLENLTHLQELRLSKNQLSDVPKDLFKGLKQLKLLDLNKNSFKQIKGLSFNGLEKLTTLKLRRNDIDELLDGAFYELPNMNSLQLDHNNISVVSKGWLYGLGTLKELTLSHNRVTGIDVDGWEFCRELEYLELSHNRLRGIERDTFAHLPQMRRLMLRDNRISSIAEGAFNRTPHLEILDLSNNDISWTIEDLTGAFASLQRLLTLNLASNHITSINRKTFASLVQLQQLDLRNNSLTAVQQDSFSEMHHLSELHLNSSALLCDCALAWLPGWLLRSGFLHTTAARCAHPPWLKGKLVTEVSSSNFTCDDFPKPLLVEEPRRQVALRGENVTLVCRATSSAEAPMQFQWKRDNVELAATLPEQQVQYERSLDGKMSEHRSELRMQNVTNADSGKYQCVASNTYGTTYSHKAKLSVLIFPVFTKRPGNVTLKSGTTAKLECAAEGEPRPQIAWQKDGGNDFPAARERRMHVFPADVIFFIVNVKLVDMGVYSCMAQNEAGKVVANATLTVLEPPSLVKPMESREVSAGESTVLECMAAGSPKPRLTWLKDGTTLQPTPRHFFTAENQLLIIVNTAPADAGSYQCELTNTLGAEVGSSQLTVIPASVVGTSAEAVIGYIVISVVICTVITSFVWVVIIYHSRKRRPSSAHPPGPEEGGGGGGLTVSPIAPVTAPSVDLPGEEELEEDEGVAACSRLQLDNTSEHSSSDDKDSGTGDSDKRSSDDLAVGIPQEEDEEEVEEHSCPLLPATRIQSGMRRPIPPPRAVVVSSVEGAETMDPEGRVVVVRTLSTFHPQPTNHERCQTAR